MDVKISKEVCLKFLGIFFKDRTVFPNIETGVDVSNLKRFDGMNKDLLRTVKGAVFHHTKLTLDGSKVFLAMISLGGGVRIIFLDSGVNAEKIAALFATLSRDPGSTESRIKKMTPEMIESIMRVYYSGYGHNSIGELGPCKVIIEGISMLAADYIFNVFNKGGGQAVSTRFVNWDEVCNSDKKPYYIPDEFSDCKEFEYINDSYIEIYKEVFDTLKEVFSKTMSEDVALAKALDISGAYLSISSRTSMVMVTNIRDVISAWRVLISSELSEVRRIGVALMFLSDCCFPNSVDIKWGGKDNENFGRIADLEDALNGLVLESNLTEKNVITDFGNFNSRKFGKFISNLGGVEVVKDYSRFFSYKNFFNAFGMISSEFVISFRSWRDALRHRVFSKVIKLPERITFCNWYSKELRRIDEQLEARVSNRLSALFIKAQGVISSSSYDNLSYDCILYLLAMGVNIEAHMSGNIGHWLYFLKLRSGIKVHPEFRTVVHKIIKQVSCETGIPEDSLGNLEPNTNYDARGDDSKKVS